MSNAAEQGIQHAGLTRLAATDQQQNAFSEADQQGGGDHHLRTVGERGGHNIDRHTIEAECHADQANHQPHSEKLAGDLRDKPRVDNNAPYHPDHYAGQHQQHQPVTQGERTLNYVVLLLAEKPVGFINPRQMRIFLYPRGITQREQQPNQRGDDPHHNAQP